MQKRVVRLSHNLSEIEVWENRPLISRWECDKLKVASTLGYSKLGRLWIKGVQDLFRKVEVPLLRSVEWPSAEESSRWG